jgi:hypothetical protein
VGQRGAEAVARHEVLHEAHHHLPRPSQHSASQPRENSLEEELPRAHLLAVGSGYNVFSCRQRAANPCCPCRPLWGWPLSSGSSSGRAGGAPLKSGRQWPPSFHGEQEQPLRLTSGRPTLRAASRASRYWNLRSSLSCGARRGARWRGRSRTPAGAAALWPRRK